MTRWTDLTERKWNRRQIASTTLLLLTGLPLWNQLPPAEKVTRAGEDSKARGSGEAPESFGLPRGMNGDFAGETDHPADPADIMRR